MLCRLSPRAKNNNHPTQPLDPWIAHPHVASSFVTLHEIEEIMSSLRIAVLLATVLMIIVDWSTALPAGDKERLLNEVDMVDDDSSVETALINYLFRKQIEKRLRSQLDVTDLQRKRSYWKQCAFNAVSCFGK